MMPLIFIFVIFYFLLIRPQQKKQKEHEKLVQAVKTGRSTSVARVDLAPWIQPA